MCFNIIKAGIHEIILHNVLHNAGKMCVILFFCIVNF